ncbi:hypothetical protein [Antarctobacter sp.]|uniref:hypothetical protein n=1 Tax=Antarctobacter sp. TaxID=1872577 RepID=UPI002B279DAF|nr:hypothetical protein [Antarctobacter sp.]
MTPEIKEELEKIGLTKAIAKTVHRPGHITSLLSRFSPSGALNPQNSKHRKEMAEQLQQVRQHAADLRNGLMDIKLDQLRAMDLHFTAPSERDDGIPKHMKRWTDHLVDLIAVLDHEIEMKLMVHGEQIAMQTGPSKAEHARKVASAIAEIYYLAFEKVPGAGNNGGEPSGPYGIAVKTVLRLLGVTTGWRAPAEEARDEIARNLVHLDRLLNYESLKRRPSIFDMR